MGTNAGEGKKQENKKEEILKVSREFFIEQGYRRQVCGRLRLPLM